MSARTLAKRWLGSLPDPLEGRVRGWIDLTRQLIGRIAPRDRLPIRLSGSGPVVLVDARGSDLVEVLASIDEEYAVRHRLVLATDDPRAHLYHATSCAVIEYLPADATTDGTGERCRSARLSELSRLYRVERISRFEDVDRQGGGERVQTASA